MKKNDMIYIPGEMALGTAARSASGNLCLWAGLAEFWTLLFLRGCSDNLPAPPLPPWLSVFCRTDRLSSSASAISGLRIFFNLGFVKSSKIFANCSGSMSSSDLSAVFFFRLLLDFGFPPRLREDEEDWLLRVLLWNVRLIKSWLGDNGWLLCQVSKQVVLLHNFIFYEL